MEKSAVKFCCCRLKADNKRATEWSSSMKFNRQIMGIKEERQWGMRTVRMTRSTEREMIWKELQLKSNERWSEMKKPQDRATDWSPDWRNDDSKQRLWWIDWQVNNLKLFPWDRSNFFLFKEEKMTTPAMKKTGERQIKLWNKPRG